MSQSQRSAPHVRSDNFVQLDDETHPKFLALKNIFWIKLGDFMDNVPRHPHLRAVRLNTRAMVIHEFPFGKGANLEVRGTGKAETANDTNQEREKETDKRSDVNGSHEGGGGGMVNGFR